MLMELIFLLVYSWKFVAKSLIPILPQREGHALLESEQICEISGRLFQQLRAIPLLARQMERTFE